MQFKALRPLYGSYGPDGSSVMVLADQLFEVPEHMVKKMEHLEARGIVQRYRPREAKAFTVYKNKSIRPPLNKS